MVVMADSSSKRLEDRLGNVLVKQGKLGQGAPRGGARRRRRRRCSAWATSSPRNSYITSKDLKEALQVQVSQIVFKVFRWRDGDYHFAPTDTVDYDRENFTPMSADFILMEGIRMVDEWPIIEKKIPSMDIVFRPVVDPSMIEVGSGPRRSAGRRASGPRRAPPTRSASPPRRSGSTARSTARARCRPSSTPRASASSRSAAPCFDLLNRNIIAPAGQGVDRAGGRGGADGEHRSPSTPGYAVMALVVLLAAAGRPGAVAHALRRDGPRAPCSRTRRPAAARAVSLLAAASGSTGPSRPTHLLQGSPLRSASRTSSTRASWTESALHDPWRAALPLRPGGHRLPPERGRRQRQDRARAPSSSGSLPAERP